MPVLDQDEAGSEAELPHVQDGVVDVDTALAAGVATMRPDQVYDDDDDGDMDRRPLDDVLQELVMREEEEEELEDEGGEEEDVEDEGGGWDVAGQGEAVTDLDATIDADAAVMDAQTQESRAMNSDPVLSTVSSVSF
jgi:hypothetical protein